MDVKSVSVELTGARYRVDVTVDLAVPARAAYAVMTDFSALPQVNPDVVVSKRLPNGRLHTVVSMCILFFCKDLEQLQRVTMRAPNYLAADVIPARSDLAYGHAEWHFRVLGPNRSRVRFEAVAQPGFWVPPLIGPWLVKKKMREEAIQTCKGIERVVRDEQAG